MTAYLSLSAWLISLPSLWIVVCVRNFDRLGWRNENAGLDIHGGWFWVYYRTNLNTIYISSLIDINGLNGSEGDWLCGEPGLVSSSFFFFPNRLHWIGQDWSIVHFSSLWIVIWFDAFQVLVFDHIMSNVWRSVSPNTRRSPSSSSPSSSSSSSSSPSSSYLQVGPGDEVDWFRSDLEESPVIAIKKKSLVNKLDDLARREILTTIIISITTTSTIITMIAIEEVSCQQYGWPGQTWDHYHCHQCHGPANMNSRCFQCSWW